MLEGPEVRNVRADRILDELQRSPRRSPRRLAREAHVEDDDGVVGGADAVASVKTSMRTSAQKFVEDGSHQSGGQFAQVLVDSGIPTAMKSLADEARVPMERPYYTAAHRIGAEEDQRVGDAIRSEGAHEYR